MTKDGGQPSVAMKKEEFELHSYYGEVMGEIATLQEEISHLEKDLEKPEKEYSPNTEWLKGELEKKRGELAVLQEGLEDITATVREQDKLLGEKMREVFILNQVASSLISKVLFPDGLHVRDIVTTIAKHQNIDVNQLVTQIFTAILKNALNGLGDPYFLNSSLEPALDSQLKLTELKKELAFESNKSWLYGRVDALKQEIETLEGPTKEGLSEQELLQILMGEPVEPADKAQAYQKLGMDILKIAIPKEAPLAEKAVNFLGIDFGTYAQRLVEGNIQQVAMSFDNRGFAAIAEAGMDALQGPPSPEISPEEKKATQERVRSKLEQVIKNQVRSALGAEQKQGWISYGLSFVWNEETKPVQEVANFAAGGLTQIYDVLQLEAVNGLLLQELFSAVGNSIEEVSQKESSI